KTTMYARQLPPELLARVAFFGVTRCSIPAAADPTVLGSIHSLECSELAERRRVCMAWCTTFSPLLFHLVSIDAGTEALLEALQPRASAQDGEVEGSVGGGSVAAAAATTAADRTGARGRLPCIAGLVRILYISDDAKDKYFLRLLRSVALPRVHSIYVESYNARWLLPWLPRSPLVKLFSLRVPAGIFRRGDETQAFLALVEYLRELPALENLELIYKGCVFTPPHFDTNEVMLPQLTGLRAIGIGLTCSLVCAKVFDPANIAWFSGSELDDRDVSVLADRVCFKLPSLRCLDLRYYSIFDSERCKELICEAPPTLAHLCITSETEDSADESAKMPWLAAHHFYGSSAADGGEAKKLLLFFQTWESILDHERRPYGNYPDFDKRLEDGSFRLEPVDSRLRHWEVVRYGATPDED
ncbi:hypothetical protein HK405_012476, partial [Cladochytrium tenue]